MKPRASLFLAGIAVLLAACSRAPAPPTQVAYEKVPFALLSAFDTGEPSVEELLKQLSSQAPTGRYKSLEEMEDFQLEVPEIRIDDIPDTIRVHNGRSVAIVGFMVPIEISDTGVQSFLLLRNQALCCYGLLPRLNDFIFVRMPAGKAIEYVADFAITARGRLEMGMGVADELHYLYRMTADDVEIPPIYDETKKNVGEIQQRLLKEGSRF